MKLFIQCDSLIISGSVKYAAELRYHTPGIRDYVLHTR